MNAIRIVLLVLGTIVITLVISALMTRRQPAVDDHVVPLDGRSGVEPGDVAALIASIERLVDVLERSSPARLEGPRATGLDAAAAAPQRQPAGPSIDASFLELLREQNERLAQIQSALLDGVRSDHGGAPAVAKLRATVEAGHRPIRLDAWEAFFSRFPPSKLEEQLPVELAVLGVAEVMEKFGSPSMARPPQSLEGSWSLMYEGLNVRTPDGVVTRVDLNCSRDATFYVSHNKL
jgi:hypothetical protein